MIELIKLIFVAALLPFKIVFAIVSLPFRILFALDTSKNRRSYRNNNNIWGLSKEDRRIARQERMSDADYIEAEERDDDNLDYDD